MMSELEDYNVQAPEGFAWTNFGAYKAFDDFLKALFLDRKSFISSNSISIDPIPALKDIANRFVDGFDDSENSFDEKAGNQFKDASANTKLLFAKNIERCLKFIEYNASYMGLTFP